MVELAGFRPRRARVLALVVCAAALVQPCSLAAAGAKTDLVVQRNGDRVTCEIKELLRGQLSVKTDGMGTLSIDWDKVVRLASPVRQEVQVSSGEIYHGHLEAAKEDGRVAVVTAGGPVELELATIVHMRQLRSSFWRRFDGSLDIGGSFTQANQLLQLTPSFTTTYGARRYSAGLDFSSTLTRQEGADDSDRTNLTLRYSRFFASRWVGFGRATVQRSTELGLDLRGELAGGAGRFLVSTNRSSFAVGTGLAVNRERPLEGESTSNLEGLVIVQWELFSYNFPKTDVRFSFLVYPGLSDWGRVRGDADLSLKRELFRNFTIGLRVYDSFDNRPATEGSAQNDWGATLSVGLTF
ncbi:MAG: DUF481 domain-containing protein [Solirubrobacterales bacterium]|jgi:hypothetical protein